jgi:hypothetical protein
MRARHRHLSYKAAGAVVAYDARYLNDSDGTALQTWPNRASTSYDATESSSTKRPLVKTGANGINGQTALQFDGTDDDLQAASVPLNTFITVVVCGKFTFLKQFFFEHSANANFSNGFYFYGDQNGAWAFSRGGNFHFGGNSANWFGNNNAIGSLAYSGSAQYRLNGGAPLSNGGGSGAASTNSSTTTNFNICSRNRASVFSDGLLGCLAVYDGAAADPLRKRLEHAAAYSFKIACN